MKAPRAKLRLSAAEELENVAVVNRHTYSGPRDNSYIYIGRGTPLGNQWSHTPGTAAAHRVETREQAVSTFQEWLSSQIDKGEGPVFRAIQQIKERVAIGEQIKLACSCVPQLCHGDVIKGTIELLIHNDRHPAQTLQLEPRQIQPSQPALDKSTQAVPAATERMPAPALSGRAEQAHAEVIATDTISDDLFALYNVQEGMTRAEHASHLNSIDQFAREAFERGATLNEGVLSIPKDPDARPRDDSKVTIGTEAHAINFVRGFIADPTVATEKGRLLFELGNKACGQWMDSDGRLTVFNHIYTAIRQDESGAYRSNEEKAEYIDKVLEETALWAQQLPEPIPEPTAEQVHEYTLALAEENHALTLGQIPDHGADRQTLGLEPEPPSLYLEHLQSSSYGLATIGELSGFSDLQFDSTLEGSDLSIDENQIYADMYEMAISDTLEFATPEGDHLGAERELGTSVTLDAAFDRINLAALPPQIPDSLTLETQTELFERVLPSVDTQLENGVSKKEILSPIYETNREIAQRDLENRVTETFARADSNPLSERIVSRAEELNAVSSLRILVGAEYRQQTKPFSRAAIQWAKENYRVNPDWLRSQGKLQQGEYQRIVTAQSDARAAWQNNNPGQQAPTRAEIASINKLERSGHQLNARIAGINPTPKEHAQTLDLIQSRLASATLTAETLLQNYEAAEQTSQQLAVEAIQYADKVRASSEFQELKASIQTAVRENSIDERQALIRANNPRFNTPTELPSERRGSNYPELTGDARPLSPYAELSLSNDVTQRDALQTLADMLVSPEIETAQALNNAQLASYNELCNHLTGITITPITGASQAREAITAKLQGLDRASTMVDATRTRFGLPEQPKVLVDLSPTPAYLSLTSSPNVRVPVENQREYGVVLTTAEQCRLDTSTWSSLYNPHAISGVDQERADLARFVSTYIDFRLKDHTTQELSYNPTFRNYSERLAVARHPEELLQTSAQIKLENYELHQQLVAHRADPTNIAAPDRQPLTVMEMREVFLSTNPTAAPTRADRDEIRDILQSMAVFGKEKTERVQLLAQGKIAPSSTLSKLLANLDTRQTVRAVNHFYSSLRTPAAELLTQNRFDLHKAHARLPQYERDFLHNHALAQKYEAVNNKQQGAQLTPEQTIKPLIPAIERTGPYAPIPSKTDFYREYYGRADWLEAQKIVTASANLEKGASANLELSTIIPELKDLEVQAINYAVNNFDETRQQQVAEHLRNSPYEHQQAIGDMITIASEIKVAGAAPDVKEVELELPASYSLSPDSVTTIVNYTQQESGRATDAAQLPAPELSDLRREAQAQAWRDMEREVIKDPASILDAPAEVLYQAQQLAHGINQTAALQERARTAFQTLNAHTTACVNKAEQVVAQEQPPTQPFRPAEQQQTTRELVKVALNPELQQSNAGLIKANAPEYALIKQTLTPTDRERATQLKDYAANTRADYLRPFSNLDRDQQAVKAQETRASVETRTAGTTQTTMDRYTIARDEIARTMLGEKVQEMVQAKSLPEIAPEQIATLTVKDLLPAEVREAAVEQAREPAWQSLEPQELRDVAAGREVPEPLVTLADEAMDRVAIAQTVELELDDKRAELSTFIAEQVALVEAPIKEERDTLAYDERFRETIIAIPSDNSQSPERVDAANQILQTLERAELDPATLVTQAITHELDLVPADITFEANAAAIAHAQDVREQPVFNSVEARELMQQQVIAELTGPAADRYTELHANVEAVQEKFQSSVHNIDEKLTELDLARADITKETKLQEFRDISRPAAIEINTYLKDTAREEGLPALLDPDRFDQHVQQVANVIIETARNNGITLGATRESAQEINQVAGNLFNTLASGMERANSEHAITHQLTHQHNAAAPLTEQTFNQLAATTAPIASNGDHAAHASFDQRDQQRQREETDRQKQGASPTKIHDHSGREPNAQEVAKAQDIIAPTPGGSMTELGGNAAELGGSIEDIAAVLAL
jgi:hypothetical protein